MQQEIHSHQDSDGAMNSSGTTDGKFVTVFGDLA